MAAAVAARFRRIFRLAHARHPACLRDEWLTHPCADEAGVPAPRPIVWSRRNGPWRRHHLLFVGAAPGNAGGKGAGQLGAHGTRIPFGGDIAGANLDVLLGSIGLDRNHTFITAALNQLPVAGGGEPTAAEILAGVGDYASSIQLLRDTVVAAGPCLVVLLGQVAARALVAALDGDRSRLPGLKRIQRAGIVRGELSAWPSGLPVANGFRQDWQAAWRDTDPPHLLLLTHPSAQNMSPFARSETRFHARMLEARTHLRAAVAEVLGWEPPTTRPGLPATGVYSLPEWRNLIAPRHLRLDRLWRAHGL